MMGHVYIYGPIGSGKGEISFKNVKDQLSLPENKAAEEITVHIISPGGDVFEGEAIYNALKNAGKPVTTHIEGTCASIATLIAGAGYIIIMNRTARFMIHNPKIASISEAIDANELRNVANQLDQIKTLLIDVYDRKTSLGKEKLWELYDNETWLTAEEAEKMGFIDESTDAIKAVANINSNQFKMESKDKNWLKAMKNFFIKKFKNEFTETLADGTIVIVMSEDGEWVGKQIVREDGSPLEPGNYTLASGKVITVGDNSTITEVGEAQAPPAEDQNAEDMSKIQELEAKLAAAEAAKKEADEKIAAMEQATNQVTAKFEARFKALEEKDKAKEKKEEEEGKKVLGQAPKKGGPNFVNASGEDDQFDPMGEDALKLLKNRNIIRHEQE